MPTRKAIPKTADPTARYARMLAAHPDGMVVGDIQSELGIPPSTLSHHLDRLKAEGLVTVQRESTFLRCFSNTAVLEELLGFLFAECCTRSKAIKADTVIKICGIGPKGRCT